MPSVRGAPPSALTGALAASQARVAKERKTKTRQRRRLQAVDMKKGRRKKDALMLLMRMMKSQYVGSGVSISITPNATWHVPNSRM